MFLAGLRFVFGKKKKETLGQRWLQNNNAGPQNEMDEHGP